MRQIVSQYASLTPIREFQWELSDKELFDSQPELIQRLLNHPQLSQYPPSSQYRFSFYKCLISKLECALEDDDMEVRQEFYDEFMDALSQSKSGSGPPEASYKTYFYNDDPLTLYEDQTTISKGTTGLVTWVSAQSMAGDIFNPHTDLHRQLSQSSKVLELGAGCGLVSLAASKVFDGTVFATDVDDNVLQRLENNVKLNALPTKVLKLDWFKDIHIVSNIIPDTVVAADIVYDDYLFPPLLSVLKECLRVNDKCKIFIRGVVRNEQTCKQFIDLLKSSIEHDISINDIKNECNGNRSHEVMYDVVIG
ncbi:hypothetical protein E3P99_02336 [Wallemia hederae]|uniref:FAM86 N-terminal domain-containing protein n=1 Tax=Wallemia hederae TaxID=1540922 RepID=A0A4T0FKQ7_9BASI|nr:hypothetical protein E3P99_02336 [Wallemia hederae]